MNDAMELLKKAERALASAELLRMCFDLAIEVDDFRAFLKITCAWVERLYCNMV